jgi:hypothetical protein
VVHLILARRANIISSNTSTPQKQCILESFKLHSDQPTLVDPMRMRAHTHVCEKVSRVASEKGRVWKEMVQDRTAGTPSGGSVLYWG